MCEHPFETLTSERIHMGRFIIVSDQVEVNEKVCPYDYIEMKEGVCILPFHGDKVITLKEYRYPIRSWQRELLGGLIDLGETPEESAKRELLEETGYEAEVLNLEEIPVEELKYMIASGEFMHGAGLAAWAKHCCR